MVKMLNHTNDPGFHKLSLNEKLFKQDIMSYMNICYTMEQIGLDTSCYRKNLTSILPRIYSGFG